MNDNLHIKIVDVINIKGLGKVVVYTDKPDKFPIIKVGDNILVRNGDNFASAVVKGIELLNYRNPENNKPSIGGLKIAWRDKVISDQDLKGAMFCLE